MLGLDKFAYYQIFLCLSSRPICFAYSSYLLLTAKSITVVLFRSRNLSMPNYRDEEEGVLNV